MAPAEPLDLTLTVVDPATRRRTDVRLRADPATATGDALLALAGCARGAPGPPALVPAHVAGRPLDLAAPLALSALRPGSVVVLGEPAGAAAATPSVRPVVRELRVIGGPAAGVVHRLPAGSVVVGRGEGCAVRIDDLRVSRRHAELSVDPAGEVTVTDLGSANGTLVDGEPVAGRAPLPAGAMLALGDSLLACAVPGDDLAALAPGPGTTLAVNRPPRLRPVVPAVTVTLPAPPDPPETGRLATAALAAPLLLGLAMCAVLRSWQYLLLAVLSPVATIAGAVGDRRSARAGHRRRLREHATALLAARSGLAAACRDDERRRRDAAPDPASLLLAATGPTGRLWERRRGDDDFLLLRIGVADRPAEIVVERPPGAGPPGQPEARPVARAVPVTVPLRSAGVLGVAGPPPHAQSLVRWLLGQLAVLHAPSDVRLVVLAGDRGEAEWGLLRWLPHARADPERSRPVLLGTGHRSTAQRVDELLRLVSIRTGGHGRAGSGMASSDTGSDAGRAPAVVVLLDGAHRLRDCPGVSQLLATGPAVGVHAICLDAEERLLPRECGAVVTFAEAPLAHRARVQAGGTTVDGVLVDQVDAGWGDAVGRALAPLRPAGGSGRADGDLPAGRDLRLLDVSGVVPDEDELVRRWAGAPADPVAVIGTGAGGPVAVDLRRDGPHALVAGITGAGKSELLRTLVAALALRNRPDALALVLVDYKGGAAFRGCAGLPHVVGLITDLDAGLGERALRSLAAELRRREEALAAGGATDLDELWRRPAPGPVPPRLVIVVDEFATLVEELPDFVRGLVGVAQRGRSLGVHLVLATQRPGGVVAADIRANTNLRICLRVASAAESSDVLDAPDAATIPDDRPGQGYLRTGGSPLVGFQAARVGLPVRPAEPTGPRCELLPWARLGDADPVTGGPAGGEPDGLTDLDAVVKATSGAARRLGLPPQPAPWLPPLPERVTVTELTELTSPAGLAGDPSGAEGGVPLGLVDVPERQARRLLRLDVERGGHLLVAGSARSGRTTTLRTVAGALAGRWSPDDLHLHVLDCAAGELRAVSALPHCGAVVTHDDGARVDRLLTRLTGEVARRQRLLAAGGFAGAAEQRAASPPGERLPWLVLLLDGWEGFVGSYAEADGGRLLDAATSLLRTGPGAGLRAVISADRSGLVGRLPALIADRLLLRLPDAADYALAGASGRHAPAAMPGGRAVRVGADGTHDAQVALLADDRSGGAGQGTGQGAALAALAHALAERCGGRPRLHRPLRVDALPPRVSCREALSTAALGATATLGAMAALGAAEADGAPPGSALWALVGVGGDELGPVGVDLAADGPGFLVAGAAGTGRSTALLTMAAHLHEHGRTLAVVAPRPSPLRHLAGRPGVATVVTDGADATQAATLEALAHRHGPGLVVVVDDAELVPDGPLASVLATTVRIARDRGHAVLVAGTTDDLHAAFRGFAVDVRRSRSGLLLAPRSPSDGDLLGVRLPRGACDAAVPGRAALVLKGVAAPVQVAIPDD
ncbi:MAG: FtsK/SpoIIIE domain-containing protein [Frankiaceae bacterium]